MITSTKAIVLHQVKYAETSIIVTYTRSILSPVVYNEWHQKCEIETKNGLVTALVSTRN